MVEKPSIDTSGLNKQQKKKVKLAEQFKAEDQQRSEGLKSAISSSNIGFKMLQQMGYKPGAALGKHGQGSVEPINMDVKRSRSGLGRDHVEKAHEQLKVKMAQFKHDVEKRKQSELRAGFEERRKSSWQGRKLISDYRKARTALCHLEEAAHSSDEHKGHDKKEGSESKEPTKSSDKDKEEDPDNGEDDSEEEIEPQDLQDLLERLRTEFFYCLYCGCKYESADALLANCPGLEDDAH